MKGFIIIIISAIFAIINSFSGMSQSNYYCGSYMIYDTTGLSSEIVPEGYKAVLINHLGRHGSRFPVSDKNILAIQNILKQAQSLNRLTPQGEILFRQLNELNDKCQNQWGLLTPVGAKQQFDLAQRLVQRVGVKTFSSMRIWYDEKERCVQSYESFMKGLYEAGISVNSKVNKTLLKEKNPLLNFYKTNLSYVDFKDGKNLADIIDSYTKEELNEINLLQYFVKDVSSYSSDQQMDFAIALFNCITMAPNVPYDLTGSSIVNIENKERLWRVDNAKQYLAKGPSPIADNIQINISLPLLRNFIDTSEDGLSQNNYSAYLRFAHAETLIPFAAFLQIPEASVSTPNSDDIYKVWKDFIVAPMNANIVWIFYKNAAGNCLVKMLLNEHEVHFPVSTDSFPYYDWIKVRTFYMKKINNMLQGATSSK